jgi:Methylase involved in ubiquinone/menaquinone biosynthesis
MCLCRLCNFRETKTAIDFGYQPIVHNLLSKPSENVERFQFKLMHCPNCDFLYLNNPISRNILYKDYFTVSSWKNQPHVSRLIDLMKHLANLNDKTSVLDVGCNDGSFLKLLFEKGVKNVKGIEPADDAYNIAIKNDFKVEQGFFGASNKNIVYEENKYDLLITRHVLEHIIDLDDFLSGINIVLKNSGTLVIEIPDTSMNLQYFDYALWEEHVNYFTLSSLKELLSKFDLEIFHYEITYFR